MIIMSYTFKKQLVPSGKYNIKCPYSMTPEYITVHDTANVSPAKNEINYMISNNNPTSFHVAIDENEVIQGVPFNRNVFACGDGAKGTGNRKSISVEICRPKNPNRSLYDQAEENAVYVVARLLYQFGLGIDRLKKHQDWSEKKCPNLILSEKRWDSFKNRVRWVLDEIKKGNIDSKLESGTTSLKPTQPTQPQPSKPTASAKPFKVGDYSGMVVTTDSLNVRTERNATSKVLGTLSKGAKVKVNYIMYENNKTTGKSLWGSISYNGKTGFVNLTYCKPC